MVLGGQALRGTATRRIIIANVVVAVVGLVFRIMGLPNYFMEYGALYVPDLFKGYVWQLLTYMWVHAELQGIGVLHVVFNMLTLAAFGPVVERNLGVGNFWRLYLFGGVVSGLFFVVETLVRLSFGVEEVLPLVGASGAVLAVCAAFAWMFPEARLFLFLIPVPIKARAVVVGAIVVSVVLLVVDSGSFIAHSAHLGGILCGLVYMRGLTRRLMRRGYGVEEPAPEVVVEEVEDELASWDRDRLEWEAERVLGKISRYGLGALTARDREILERVRRR